MKTKTKSASALIFATILLFVVLSLVVSMSYVTVLEQKMSQKTKSSVGAFFSADSGIEWTLNKISHNSGANINDNFTMLAGGKIQTGLGGIDVYLLDKDGNIITSDDTLDSIKAVRAVGTESTGSTTRAIEAAVASGSGPSGWSCQLISGSEAGAHSVTEALCTGSKKLITGGCKSTNGGPLQFNSPANNGWRCEGASASSTPYAWCCE